MNEASALYQQSLAAHEKRETSRSIALARQAVDADPKFAAALEHLGTLLITRKQHFAEGLAFVRRAVDARPDDAGLWYSLGWCYEFVAHDARRHRRDDVDARDLYTLAAEAFRHCLTLNPDGKLQGDAEDLLDHVDNELAQD